MFVILSGCAAMAQQVYENESKAEASGISKALPKFFAGGTLGATFGDLTEIRLSPILGYRVSPEFSIAGKVTYRHSWQNATDQAGNSITISEDDFGGGGLIQYFPVKEFYLLSEFSAQKYRTETTQQDVERSVNFLFLGAGYSTNLAPMVFLNAGLKVDVLNDLDSPFDNFTPFFDVTIGVGF